MIQSLTVSSHDIPQPHRLHLTLFKQHEGLHPCTLLLCSLAALSHPPDTMLHYYQY